MLEFQSALTPSPSPKLGEGGRKVLQGASQSLSHGEKDLG
ncbi:hypothetical protein GFS31_11580 [Leptolyngbya sp. BL0902]|nr:hypothetical protein GFS31_11580 [Leptolyngbya sp. BL0902]